MGYTNYYTTKETISKEQRQKMVAFTKSIVKNNPSIKICGWDGRGKPKITQKLISFNGEQSSDQDCETFTLLGPREEWQTGNFNFTKTRAYPYDAILKACLMYALEIGVVTEWSFDGEETEEEFLTAQELFRFEMELLK